MAAEVGHRLLLRTFSSHSPDATEALGEALGLLLEAGTIVTLDGELGSGKTCFVRGLARGLGVVELVQSPTYSLMHTYPGRLELYHFDAWMEGRERAFLLDGGLEWMQAGGVSVIEWGSRVSECLPRPLLSLTFEHRGPSTRRIEFAILGLANGGLANGALAIGDRAGGGNTNGARALTELVSRMLPPPGIEETH